MKKLLIVLLLVVLFGCGGDDRIKITYGEWENQDVVVAVVAGETATLLTPDKTTYSLSNRGWKQGDRVSIQVRKVYTSFCENGRCELLKTEAEIK